MIRCMGCMEEFDDRAEICPHCGYRVGQPPKEAYYLDPGTILNGQYMVGKVLGYGGFGVTYIGWDMTLGRKTAIKEYLPSDFATRVHGERRLTIYSEDAKEQFQSGLQSFISEAQKLAKFNNIPEIVDIYDCFIENDTGYIVMEFLYGQTVKELLAKGKAFSYPTAIKIIKAILTGLENVHQAGIIHRDIAPDNIFITVDDEIRLLDFGAARYAVTKHSRSLSVILKPGYAPEEQYRSKGEQGPWTDVYGAGATLYRMITGIRPQESIERLTEDRVKTPSELGIEIPQSVENALMNAINVRRQDRFATAQEFLDALESDHVERKEATPIDSGKLKMPGWVKGVTVGCIVTAAAVIAVLARRELPVFSWNQGQRVELQKGEAYLPDMTGLSYEEAQQKMADVCSLIISGKNYSTTVEYNKILYQTPEAGEIIHEGDEVQVIMSGGTQEVTMPDLESLTEEEAKAVVEAQGLVIEKKGIRKDYNELVEKGRVYAQSTKAGEKLTPGTAVELEVSLGRLEDETVILTVPDLVGKTKKEAEAILKELKETEGFTYPLGDIQKEYNVEIPKGQIISQSLQAGEQVRTNSAISLVISKGPRMVEMPDVVYLTKEEAERALEDLNLKVSTSNVYSSSVKSGSVVSQGTQAGEEVAEGSTIKLNVSIGPEPVQSAPQYSEPSGGGSSSGNSGGWTLDDGDEGWKLD